MSYPWNSFDTLTAADLNAAIGMAASSGTTVAGGTNNVGRNLIHNSMFNIAQRGAGPWTTSGIYSLDRWRISSAIVTGGGFTVTQAPHNDASRAAIGDEAATNLLSYACNTTGAGANDFDVVQQYIEGVRRLAGKTVIVSFYAASAVAARKVGISLDQSFGTGGSPTPIATGAGVAVTLSTTWARYSVTLTLPSAASPIVFGTTPGTDSTVLNIWYNSGATNAARAGNIGLQGNNTVGIWGVQLEVGTVATPLEKRDPVMELQQCQRFYCRGQFYMAATSQSPAMASIALFPVPMRAAPAAIGFNTTSYTNSSAVSGVQIDGQSFICSVTVPASGWTTVNTQWTASADL